MATTQYDHDAPAAANSSRPDDRTTTTTTTAAAGRLPLDDSDLAGDLLLGAKQIAEHMTSLGIPTDEDDVYYAHRAGKLPIGKYGAHLLASRRRLTRHTQKIAAL
jgi:hypothetical protein